MAQQVTPGFGPGHLPLSLTYQRRYPADMTRRLDRSPKLTQAAREELERLQQEPPVNTDRGNPIWPPVSQTEVIVPDDIVMHDSEEMDEPERMVRPQVQVYQDFMVVEAPKPGLSIEDAARAMSAYIQEIIRRSS